MVFDVPARLLGNRDHEQVLKRIIEENAIQHLLSLGCKHPRFVRASDCTLIVTSGALFYLIFVSYLSEPIHGYFIKYRSE